MDFKEVYHNWDCYQKSKDGLLLIESLEMQNVQMSIFDKNIALKTFQETMMNVKNSSESK